MEIIKSGIGTNAGGPHPCTNGEGGSCICNLANAYGPCANAHDCGNTCIGTNY